MKMLNKNMPPEPFMKMAAKEVLKLRERVSALEEENRTLMDENDALRRQRLSYEDSVRIKNEINILKGHVKALSEDKGMTKMRRDNKALRIHSIEIAKRYVEAYNGQRPPRFKYLLELAYIAGSTDPERDFPAFYRSICDETNTE